MARELKTIYTKDIAEMTQVLLERATKKHKSIYAYCIFAEGDYFYAITPEYESEKEKMKAMKKLMNALIQRPDLCEKFAEFVTAPARFHEREAKKVVIEADKDLLWRANIACASMPEEERQRYYDEWVKDRFMYDGKKYNTFRKYVMVRLIAELSSAKAEQGA